MTFDDVDAFATKLANVTAGTSWGNRTWMVGNRGFAWQRPFSKADLKRFGDETSPGGEILGVRVESLDAKDALLAMGLPGFFTIEHFNGFAGLLIALKKARAKDVRAALTHAHAFIAQKKPAAPRTRKAPARTKKR